MREGNVNILARVGSKETQASIHPWKADPWRCIIPVSHVMEVSDILAVLEGEPVIRRKESGGTER